MSARKETQLHQGSSVGCFLISVVTSRLRSCYTEAKLCAAGTLTEQAGRISNIFRRPIQNTGAGRTLEVLARLLTTLTIQSGGFKFVAKPLIGAEQRALAI